MLAVAIDGPSGAGKSTLSRALAEKFKFIYVDTGALYRTVGLAVLRAGKTTTNPAQVEALLPDIQLGLRHVQGEQRVFLGSEDVSNAIRAEEVSMAASDVSAHPAVRAFLLESQRRLARENNVIMDGRDIGTVVLPDAEVKIFLTASVEDRANRRYLQLLEAGRVADLETVRQDVIRRDYNDSNRAAAPLCKAEDAVEVDTTGNTFEESLEALAAIIQPHLTKNEN